MGDFYLLASIQKAELRVSSGNGFSPAGPRGGNMGVLVSVYMDLSTWNTHVFPCEKYDVSDRSGRTFPSKGDRMLFNQSDGDDKPDKPPPSACSGTVRTPQHSPPHAGSIQMTRWVPVMFSQEAADSLVCSTECIWGTWFLVAVATRQLLVEAMRSRTGRD